MRSGKKQFIGSKTAINCNANILKVNKESQDFLTKGETVSEIIHSSFTNIHGKQTKSTEISSTDKLLQIKPGKFYSLVDPFTNLSFCENSQPNLGVYCLQEISTCMNFFISAYYNNGGAPCDLVDRLQASVSILYLLYVKKKAETSPLKKSQYCCHEIQQSSHQLAQRISELQSDLQEMQSTNDPESNQSCSKKLNPVNTTANNSNTLPFVLIQPVNSKEKISNLIFQNNINSISRSITSIKQSTKNSETINYQSNDNIARLNSDLDNEVKFITLYKRRPEITITVPNKVILGYEPFANSDPSKIDLSSAKSYIESHIRTVMKSRFDTSIDHVRIYPSKIKKDFLQIICSVDPDKFAAIQDSRVIAIGIYNCSLKHYRSIFRCEHCLLYGHTINVCGVKKLNKPAAVAPSNCCKYCYVYNLQHENKLDCNHSSNSKECLLYQKFMDVLDKNTEFRNNI